MKYEEGNRVGIRFIDKTLGRTTKVEVDLHFFNRFPNIKNNLYA